MIDITITPDQIVLLQWGIFRLTGTIVFTWVVIAVVLVLTWLATRHISIGPKVSRWQSTLETLVSFMRTQVAETTRQQPDRYLPFLGTLFFFISVSNLLEVVPGYHAPTGSINTTVALALTVFFAVPFFGISERGLIGYLKLYAQPTPIMLPFNIISELTRTVALAVRLFGNVMSGGLVAAVLLALVPLFVPVVLEVMGLLIGQVQAYIFAVLSAVYVGAATQRRAQTETAATGVRR
jgi:F-type H+-transporting ATPase subunit a